MKNTISEPKISTLTVELKVVRIGNKQMTKAVFNQLYHENFWDENYEVIYPIWGIVNDFPYEYIIFQKDNELRKCIIKSYGSRIDNYFHTIPAFDRIKFEEMIKLYCSNLDQLFIAV